MNLTEAERWALEAVVARPGISMNALGQHMADRPEKVERGPARLTKSQGFGRLGALMASKLRKKGLAITRPANRNGPTYMIADPTNAGRAAIRGTTRGRE